MNIKKKLKFLSILGQWFAGIIGAVGIGVEIGMGAHIGYVLITAGAIIAFVATKVRHEMGD